MSTSLALPGTPASLTAKVHPLVLFNVCDSYIRRNEGQERVIGALLGRHAHACGAQADPRRG